MKLKAMKYVPLPAECQKAREGEEKSIKAFLRWSEDRSLWSKPYWDAFRGGR